MRAPRALALSAAAVALALSAFAGEVKTDLPGGIGTERQLLQKDEETTAGTFDGTWMYVNRDVHFALWARTKDGAPQIKIQYQSLANPEAFETDWQGKTLYYMAGNPVTFELKLGDSTKDRLVGRWLWDLTVGASTRRESADVVVYRTGFGRTLMMDFQNYEKTITEHGKNRVMRAPVVWNWVKISNRELLWEELPVLTKGAARRAALSIGVASFFVVGYFGVGRLVDPHRAVELKTALDSRIPFIAASVWVYLWVFPASLLPLFLVRCPELFRRTLVAYALAIAASFAVFVAIPVTSIGLRMDPGTLDLKRASPWVVALVYRIDPPVNLFPSLHLSIALLAAASASKAKRVYGIATFLGAALIAVSIATVKQHFVVDALGAAVVAAAAYALVLRSYAPPPGTDPAFGWRGPFAYAGLMLAVYAGLYAGFRLAS